MVTHASTSSSNPVIWREVMAYLTAYFSRSPFEQQVFKPGVTFYKQTDVYKVIAHIHINLLGGI